MNIAMLPASLLIAVTLSAGQVSAQTPASAAPAAQTPATISAQSAESREFRFISTNKVATMEKELNELAAEGFRLERVSNSSMGDDIAVLVARDRNAPGDARYEYKLLATRRAGTLEKEVVEATDQGFELRGLTGMLRLGISSFGGDETVALMERPKGAATKRFDYKMISTKREKTTQKEVNEAVASGYVPVAITRGQDNNAAALLFGPNFVITIMLARPAGEQAGATANNTREYKFLTTSKVSTMEKEMNQATREGYRFEMCSNDLLVLMSRERGAKEAVPYEYQLLATRRTGTMQKELLEQAAAGYEYRATTSGLGGITTVLERGRDGGAQNARREYKLLSALREKTTQKEITDALSDGYRILDLTTLGEFVLVLDRDPKRAALNRLDD